MNATQLNGLVIRATVETGGWLPGRPVLISPISVIRTDWQAGRLDVALTKQQVADSPDINTHQPVSRQHENGGQSGPLAGGDGTAAGNYRAFWRWRPWKGVFVAAVILVRTCTDSNVQKTPVQPSCRIQSHFCIQPVRV
jgi:hypothetical protein